MPQIDYEKRKRVMQRSIALGHCVCDPKKPCPCPLFKEKNICTCAGEIPEIENSAVRLTQLLESPGCASKIDQASLKRILSGLPVQPDDPRILVGMPAGDDAGVFKISEEVAMVQTVDVFTPSVDDPYVFGQIAAANSLSDVYAMGGKPLTALSILGFPIRELDEKIMKDILRGGVDKMNEAGVWILGGHSINDREIKAGFAVTGMVHPQKIITNAGAKPGDVLILTKPIGTGMIAFASQINLAPDGWIEAISRSMTTLNRTASELMIEFGANACTDITGFGLMGHLGEMARSSGVDVDVFWDDVPIFDGVLECLSRGIIPGGAERNRESSAHHAVLSDGLNPLILELFFDPQTSGGLMVAIPEVKAESFLSRLHETGSAEAGIIGKVKRKGTGKVFIKSKAKRPVPRSTSDKKEKIMVTIQSESLNDEEKKMKPDSNEEPCCGGNTSSNDTASSGPESVLKSFKGFMQKANAPGALDVTTKQAVSVALSLLARCGPCVKSHIKKAKSMGFKQEEIDELANQAIAFGGCSVMMFYKELEL